MPRARISLLKGGPWVKFHHRYNPIAVSDVTGAMTRANWRKTPGLTKRIPNAGSFKGFFSISLDTGSLAPTKQSKPVNSTSGLGSHLVQVPANDVACDRPR